MVRVTSLTLCVVVVVVLCNFVGSHLQELELRFIHIRLLKLGAQPLLVQLLGHGLRQEMGVSW